MNITKLYENTWRIDDGGVRFFLLAGSERALMVDAGMTTKDAKSAAESLVDVPVELIITHADPDHIAGADAFDKFYMHPAEAYNYYKSQHRTGEFIPVWDGDALDLGGRSVEIIHLPGHTQGGIAVLDVGARALFSGDPVQRNGSIFMFGANRDLHAYVSSLERLYAMRDRFDLIYPAHADCPVTPDIIPALRDGALGVMSGRIKGERADMHGHAIRRCDAGVSVLLCDCDE